LGNIVLLTVFRLFEFGNHLLDLCGNLLESAVDLLDTLCDAPIVLAIKKTQAECTRAWQLA